MNNQNSAKSKSLTWVIVLAIIVFSAVIIVQRTNVFKGDKTVHSGPTIELTTDNFSEHTREGLILVDVWAEWCKPCKAMEPTIHALAEEMEGKAKVGKLDADANRKLVSELGVQVIPTLILYKDGQEVERLMGMKTKETLTQLMAVHLQE